MAGKFDDESDNVQETTPERRFLTAKDVALAVVLALILTCAAASFIGRNHFSTGTKPDDVKVQSAGFTLIELSIVLVIIGLIVGGVLVGQDLIRAAAVRAQITQIEGYNSAVNTFRGKYGELPGDMTSQTADQFGFVARGSFDGEGDGNGLIEGNWGGELGNHTGTSENGETITLWVDLSTARLVDGGFNLANPTTALGNITGSALANYFPPAKLGGGNYVYVWSNNGTNYFGLSGVSSVNDAGYNIGLGEMYATTNITVRQAYAIDAKVDDGLPQSGRVTVMYIGTGVGVVLWSHSAASDGASTCFNTTSSTYSISINGGAGLNCALSFQMQGAAR
jgi:prepilin-type N-terminal cleavage/methylation domain-containing protein